MSIKVTLDILNQKGTPAFYSDVFANRPAAGFAGRVFISTDTGAIYEDTGSAWTLIADAGAGTTGTLEQVTTNGNTTTKGIVVTSGNLAIGTATAGAPLDVHGTGTNAQFNGTGTNNAYIFFQNAGANKWRIGNFYNAGANSLDITDSVNSALRLSLRNTGEMYRNGFDTISNTPTFASAGNYAINPSLVLSTPASSTFNSGGSWSGLTTSLLNSWGGNNTIPIGAVMAGFIGVARQSFDTAGATITVNQSTGNRAICGMQVLTQTGGSNNGTISHGASLLVQGVYPTSGANITYTNYYGLLINQLDEYGGVTFTNRWGIYQGGASDKNYFAGTTLIGTSTLTGSPKLLIKQSGANYYEGVSVLCSTNDSQITFGHTGSIAAIASTFGSTGAYYPLTFFTSDVERMRILNNGATGINTSSPNANTVLTLQESSALSGALSMLNRNANQRWSLAIDAAAIDDKYFSIIDNNAGAVRFAIAPTNGSVLINIASETNTQFSSLASATNYVAIQGRTPNNTTATVIQASSVTSGSTSWYAFVAQSGNGSTITTNTMFIYGNGNVVNQNNSYGAISDIKLKENIVDATPKLDDILKLKVRNFNFINDEAKSKQIGFVAQEIEEIFPTIIEETPDRDLDNNDLGTITKSVKTTVLIPILVKAIQELNAKITSLEEQVLNLGTK
jgi:hypothetical protein